MTGEDHRNAVGSLFLPQHIAHHVHRHRVESGERLVEHQDGRVVHQRGRELDPLLVAQAQFLDLKSRPVVEAASRRSVHRFGRHRHLVAPHAVQAGPDRPVARATFILGYRPRSSGMYPNRRRVSRSIGLPSQRTSPGSGPGEAEADAHRRRLAGSVRAEEAEDRPGRAVKVAPSRATRAVALVRSETSSMRVTSSADGTWVPGSA